MSKIIFVTGMEESGRDTITEMVLEGSRNNLAKHRHVKFKDMGIDKLKNAIPGEMGKARDTIFNRIEKRISVALKSGYSVVLEGPLTLKTEDGYLPLVARRLFESLSPDVFVLFEIPNERSAPNIDWTQQEINRSYAGMYASLAGSPLKIINVGKGKVKDALKSFTKVMESFLGK